VVFTELHTICVRDEVAIDLMDLTLNPDGSPRHVDGLDPTVTVMLDQLLWWSNALRAARATHPYVA
jgi:hypothetical protein